MTGVYAASSPTTSYVKSAESRVGLDEIDFLRLLVVQMKHQDPMNPMNDMEFMSQMTQFGMLSEARAQTKSLEAMADDSGRMGEFVLGALYALQDLGDMQRVGQALDLVGKVASGSGACGLVRAVHFGQDGIILETDAGEMRLRDVSSVHIAPPVESDGMDDNVE